MNCCEDDSSLCPVCKEHFTDGTKVPACLKCGHVLCRQCAFIIIRNSDVSLRICPICRSPNTFNDVRVIYIGDIRLVSDRRKLETENQQLREILRSTKEDYENNLRALRWYQKEYTEKCDQRSKMLSYYKNSSGHLYRKMKYYRDNWYRLKNNFEKLKVHKNRLHSELSLLKNRIKLSNHNRIAVKRKNRRNDSRCTIWEISNHLRR